MEKMRVGLPLLFLLGFSVASLAQDQAPPLDPPVVDKLASDVYRIYYFGYNTLVVIGSHDVLITDPAFPPRAAVIKQEIAKLTDKQVTKIVISHEHYDHAGGTEVFSDAKVICHATCAKIFALDTLGITPKKIDETFADFKAIDLGDKIVELHHWGPGDGDAATILYVPDTKIVATADLYAVESIPGAQFFHDRNATGIRMILNRIGDMDISHSVSTHVLSTDPKYLLQARDFYNDLYDAVFDVIADTLREQDLYVAYFTAMKLSATLKLPRYAAWTNYEENLPSAVDRMVLSIIFGW